MAEEYGPYIAGVLIVVVVALILKRRSSKKKAQTGTPLPGSRPRVPPGDEYPKKQK